MERDHRYALTVTWTGNKGSGTAGYRAYERSYDVTAAGKPAIAGSADAVFRGDSACWNPEELLVAALAACHQLAYLHLCADAGIVVEAYEDHSAGSMRMTPDGIGRFHDVLLAPHVTVAEGADIAKAAELHHEAHERCFIANSVNFAVRCEPKILEQNAMGEKV